jgi:predicted MFS family arabinose efflux permease
VIDRRLLLLGLGAFVVTGDGTLVVGLLPQIAQSVRASSSMAGLSVTVFALAYAFVAPLIVRRARGVPPNRLLVSSLALLAVANAATAAAPSLVALLASRAFAGVCAGVFMPTAAAAAAVIGGPQREARALAVVVGGASAATVLGIPLGTFAGGAIGWRPVFFAVAVLTALITVAATTLSPINEPAAREAALPLVRRRGVLITLAITVLWATGSFTFFTYIGIVLHRAAGVGASGLAGLLLVFGVAGIAGAMSSGWISDVRSPLVAIRGALAIVAVATGGLASISPALGRGVSIGLTVVAMAAYGFGTWAVTPPQQRLLISYGGDERLLLSLNASAVYCGVALGSATGGLTLALTRDTAVLCVLAAVLTVLALAVSALGQR